MSLIQMIGLLCFLWSYFLDLLSRRNLLANFAVTLDLSEAEEDEFPVHKFLYKSGSSSFVRDERERRGSRGAMALAKKWGKCD